jgi:hypothetical protein
MITSKAKVHNTSLRIVKKPSAQFLAARQWLKQEVYHHLDMDQHITHSSLLILQGTIFYR